MTAIEQAKKLAEAAQTENNFMFVCDKTTVLEKVCVQFKPQIIEMVGFLDYRPKKQAIELIKRVNDCLPDNGILLHVTSERTGKSHFLIGFCYGLCFIETKSNFQNYQ